MSGGKPEADIVTARTKASAARTRLSDTLGELKLRISPKALAQDAAETLKDKGSALVTDVAETARRKPLTVAAVAGGIVLFFARRRVAGLLRRSDIKPSSKSASSKGSAK